MRDMNDLTAHLQSIFGIVSGKETIVEHRKAPTRVFLQVACQSETPSLAWHKVNIILVYNSIIEELLLLRSHEKKPTICLF